MKKEKIYFKRRIVILISIIIFICSFIMLFYYYYNNKRLDQNNNNRIETFYEKAINVERKKTINTNVKSIEENEPYIAVLEIPSIGLKRGLVYPNSQYNHVDYNIQIITGSDMPNILNGNFILASHNGASYISFFKDLFKMKMNETIYVYYDHYKYEYIFSEFYEVPKTGKVKIHKKHGKNAITLITCKKNTKDIQIVYIGYLISKEKY